MYSSNRREARLLVQIITGHGILRDHNRHLIIESHEWINEIPTVPIYYIPLREAVDGVEMRVEWSYNS